jgi:hypothetical protein
MPKAAPWSSALQGAKSASMASDLRFSGLSRWSSCRPFILVDQAAEDPAASYPRRQADDRAGVMTSQSGGRRFLAGAGGIVPSPTR